MELSFYETVDLLNENISDCLDALKNLLGSEEHHCETGMNLMHIQSLLKSSYSSLLEI